MLVGCLQPLPPTSPFGSSPDDTRAEQMTATHVIRQPLPLVAYIVFADDMSSIVDILLVAVMTFKRAVSHVFARSPRPHRLGSVERRLRYGSFNTFRAVLMQNVHCPTGGETFDNAQTWFGGYSGTITCPMPIRKIGFDCQGPFCCNAKKSRESGRRDTIGDRPVERHFVTHLLCGGPRALVALVWYAHLPATQPSP